MTLAKPARPSRSLPGFGLTLGFSLFYLSLLVLLPLSMVFLKTAGLSWEEFLGVVTDKRVVASYKLSFGTAFLAAVINLVFGILIAWVFTRYRFPFRRLLDGLIDLPFALPTAVAGIALTTLYAEQGWIGQWIPFKIVYTPIGITMALVFVGLPFVVRMVQPILQGLERELEEASYMMGATRLQTFQHIIFPEIVPAALTGFALTFARALGEYGSVVFIAGNMPMKTEITPLIIMTKLEQYDYAGATAIAVVMLVISFILLLCINGLQWWASRKTEEN
ncbi:sulfate ABC transporter permease subunit CysT [Sporosarcina cascadiensis]|uniref:sulfate ABC transporter permease subunit CysT n=1 Tax=Sporosarcina cascadiensis TaxID=2660747 RepID=UPI00129BE275|nr:sulfate ABC transporter permease subunit CysT [Sporosarcina cascadiensis]